jgi:chemotaxis response regulator CheB
VVDSMPKSAIALGAACQVASIDRIAAALCGFATISTDLGRVT